MTIEGYAILITLMLLIVSGKTVTGQTSEDIIGSITYIFYGLAAGVSILMITIHGIRWKLADSQESAENAKRGIINVIIGLVIVIIAATLVDMIL